MDAARTRVIKGSVGKWTFWYSLGNCDSRLVWGLWCQVTADGFFRTRNEPFWLRSIRFSNLVLYLPSRFSHKLRCVISQLESIQRESLKDHLDMVQQQLYQYLKMWRWESELFCALFIPFFDQTTITKSDPRVLCSNGETILKTINDPKLFIEKLTEVKFLNKFEQSKI